LFNSMIAIVRRDYDICFDMSRLILLTPEDMRRIFMLLMWRD